MDFFGFVFDFLNRWGIILTVVLTFLILMSTCGTKGKINYLNSRIDSLEGNITRLKNNNQTLRTELEEQSHYDSSYFDDLLSKKHYELLKYEKHLDENKKQLPEVKEIMIDSVD